MLSTNYMHTYSNGELEFSGQEKKNLLTHIFTMRNQQLVKAFNQLKWYLLENSLQNDILCMWLRLHNAIDLTIRPFGQLNYQTLKVVRKISFS